MHFTAELESHGGNTAGFVVPDKVVEELGGGRRPKVVVTLGEHTWRSSIAPYGGRFLLGVSMANRTAARVSAGQVYDVEVSLDAAPRTVELPPDLAAALDAAPGARAAWDALAFTHQKEHVRAVEEAKRPQTRARRVANAVEMLRPLA